MTILAAAGAAIAVLLGGSLPWGVLGTMNMRRGIGVPWAVVPMALYLWTYWQVAGGRWGSPTTAATRRAHLRANALSWRLWGLSLGAGLVGFGALVAMLMVAARLVTLPSGAPIPIPAGMPLLTALTLLSMQAIVAGVTEEAAFRGYMQGMVARRHGLLPAIVASGTLFGLLHFSSHPGDVVMMLPYYVAVSAVYGGLTWAADSILPAVVLHSAGDIVVLTRWWLTGRPEWQIGPVVPALVWEVGIDLPLFAATAASVVLGAVTVLLYLKVRSARTAEAPAPVS